MFANSESVKPQCEASKCDVGGGIRGAEDFGIWEVSRVFWWGRSFECRVRNEYIWCVCQ